MKKYKRPKNRERYRVISCVCELFFACVYTVGMGNLMDSESLISAACKPLMNNTGIVQQLIIYFFPLPFSLHTLRTLCALSLSLCTSFLPALMRNTCQSSSLGIPCSGPIRLLVPLLCTVCVSVYTSCLWFSYKKKQLLRQHFTISEYRR